MIYLIKLVECGFGEDTADLITLFQITLNKFLWWASTRMLFIFIDLANINGGCCLISVGGAQGPGKRGGKRADERVLDGRGGKLM